MPESTRSTRERAHRAPRPAPAPPAPQTGVDLPGVESAPTDEGLVSRHAALLGDPRFGSASGPQRVRLLQRLQRGYGNGYVARVVLRAVAAPEAPAAAPAPESEKLAPEQDPKFTAVEQKIGQTAKQEKQHPTAKSKAAEAQAAAQGPPNDVASQAAAAQVDKMSQQKPGEFDKKAFIEAVKKAIDAAAPKNLEEADDFKKSGKAGQVKNEVSGLVGKGKQDSEGAIKQSTTEPPDASKAKPKQVTPLAEEKPGAAPGDAGAAQAIPSPKSAAETNMDAGPAEVNQQMSQAEVTEDQLKQSNEPQFNDALDSKKTAEQNSQTAPAEYRATEAQTLGKAGADAKAAAGSQLGTMHADKSSALSSVAGQKTGAKSQDEGKRAEVAAKIESIFNQTRTEVTAILDGLDGKVTAAFESGEKAARDKFEAYVDKRMTAYKDDRYSGLLGAGRWIKDKLMGMPSEVNQFYADGRTQYLKDMEGVISNVADIVGGELGRAKARIAQGRQQVKEYVDSQPKELQQLAKEDEQNISSKFDQLESDVNSKQDALVQTLADKYVQARDALDSRIDDLKAANKGLVDAVKDAIGGVIQTIMHLKDMLLNVLSKAAGVIGDIIKAPIKFLGNLVGAIKMGLNQFVSNIGTHLKKALMGWLFGTLGDAGLQLPDSFDLKGILSLILQVLGLTYDNVRAIAVKIAGEKVVAFVEGTAQVFITLAKEGPAGLWNWVKDKIADLNIKDMVIGAIKDFVITKIIMAGVSWLIGLLNPAAAFIKACKMIYDVIMFFIERGSQIMEFVNSILDGISAIVSGSLGAAANLVENSLAKILPLAIAFLASLLGVGGIAEKIKEIIEKIRAPVTKLISAVIGPILKPIKKLYDKGAKFVKGVVDKGKAVGKAALNKVKDLGKKGLDKAKGVVGKGVGAVKEGATWVLTKLGIIKAEKSFSLAGEGHTLSASASASDVTILMASALAGRLQPKLVAAQTAVGKSQNPNKAQILGILGDALSFIKTVPSDWKQYLTTLQQEKLEKARPDAATKLDILLASLMAKLLPLSSLGIKDLKELLEEKTPKERHIPFPVQDWLRANLYERGSGWKDAKENCRTTQAKLIEDMVNDALSSPNPETRLKNLVSRGRLPAAGLAEYQSNPRSFKVSKYLGSNIGDYYHVDHKLPLAEHWQRWGWNSGDEVRWSEATDPSNLKLIVGADNLSKGSGDFGFTNKPYVGPRFTSIYAEGGIQNAKSIDGTPWSKVVD